MKLKKYIDINYDGFSFFFSKDYDIKHSLVKAWIKKNSIVDDNKIYIEYLKLPEIKRKQIKNKSINHLIMQTIKNSIIKLPNIKKMGDIK